MEAASISSVKPTVGDDYHFMFTNFSAFEKPDINLKSMSAEDATCTDKDRKQFSAPCRVGLGDG